MPIDDDITENIVYKIGEVRGEAKVIAKILEQRFGPLPPEIRTRIASADFHRLGKLKPKRLSEGVTDCRKLPSCFRVLLGVACLPSLIHMSPRLSKRYPDSPVGVPTRIRTAKGIPIDILAPS